MGFSSYFKGKSGMALWLNVILMVVVIVGIPALIFESLGWYTNHGEKIEVPDVRTMSMERAKSVLERSGFVVVISDSIETKEVRPGAVYDQTPKPGNEIKSGRIVYLVTRYENEALIEIPKLVGEHSYREAKIILTNLGFRFTPDSLVEGEDEGLLLGVYQGRKHIYAGDKVSKSKPLTLYVGGGIEYTEVVLDTVVEQEEYDPNFE